MNLTKVTITGADDSTDISHLVELSQEFPFVEWAILVSRKQEGSYRFPSRNWISVFGEAAETNGLNVSMHVCGAWVRELLMGNIDWVSLPAGVIENAQRVQINTHAEPHVSTLGMIDRLRELTGKEFIFQLDGVNEHLLPAARAYGINASGLFDTSHGAGVLPNEWPKGSPTFPCGYAGGLGPLNVLEQLELIDAAAVQEYWIDMERRVRSEDDSQLDMSAVKMVLQRSSAFMRLPR